MKTKAITGLALVSLLALAWLINDLKRKEPPVAPPATPVSIRDLLQAHSVLQNLHALSAFRAVAERTTFTEPGSKLTGPFKCTITVARHGQLFKYQRTDLQGMAKQSELFDGDATYRALMVRGKLVEETHQPGNSPSTAVGFEIKTLGLISILQHLADPKTESVYAGRSAEGWDKLTVKTPTSSWTVYADAEHLIRRVEARDSASAYDDYREVDGVRLPFSQQFFVKGKLYYELAFSKIDLNQTFGPDEFSREFISQ